MNKFLIAIAIVSLAFGAFNTQAGLDTDQLTYTTLLTPAVSTINTGSPSCVVTGTVVDVSRLVGNGAIVVTLGPGYLGSTSYTGTVNIAMASTNASAAFTNITDYTASLTSTNVGKSVVIAVDRNALKQYLRAMYTSTNDIGTASAVFVTH